MRTSDGLSCPELVELVTNYLEGKLRSPERKRFEEHLRGCAECGVYLDQMRRTVQALGRLTEETFAPEAREELRKRFRTWKRGR
jgi:anti-sigma factor RsiW